MTAQNPAYVEQKLIEQAGQGQLAAFETLVQIHYQRVFNFVLRHVANTGDAEDLTQEAFIQAQKSLPSYQGTAAFSTWLTGIALNLVRNHINRSPQWRYRFDDDDTLACLACEDADPIDRLIFDSFLGQLSTELSGLKPELREALLLVAVQELSYDEVAQATRTSMANVKNRVFRARQTLRKALLEETGALH